MGWKKTLVLLIVSVITFLGFLKNTAQTVSAVGLVCFTIVILKWLEPPHKDSNRVMLTLMEDWWDAQSSTLEREIAEWLKKMIESTNYWRVINFYDVSVEVDSGTVIPILHSFTLTEYNTVVAYISAGLGSIRIKCVSLFGIDADATIENLKVTGQVKISFKWSDKLFKPSTLMIEFAEPLDVSLELSINKPTWANTFYGTESLVESIKTALMKRHELM